MPLSLLSPKTPTPTPSKQPEKAEFQLFGLEALSQSLGPPIPPHVGAGEPSEDLLCLAVDQKSLTLAGVLAHIQEEGTQPREAKMKPNVTDLTGLSAWHISLFPI